MLYGFAVAPPMAVTKTYQFSRASAQTVRSLQQSPNLKSSRPVVELAPTHKKTSSHAAIADSVAAFCSPGGSASCWVAGSVHVISSSASEVKNRKSTVRAALRHICWGPLLVNYRSRDNGQSMTGTCAFQAIFDLCNFEQTRPAHHRRLQG